MNPNAPTLLLVDDDQAFRAVYRTLLKATGCHIIEAADRPSARASFEAHKPEIVLLDLMLPPDSSVKLGLNLLQELIDAQPQAKIIVISGAGDTRFMVQAIRQGAYDFITKPADPDVVLVVVERAKRRVLLERQLHSLQSQLQAQQPTHTMIGQSPPFMAALNLARRVAPTDLPILLTGEHGTGKELMARSIHEHSARRDGPFLPINCGALTESLLESTLFGHVKGAFTGALKDRPGLFAQAHQGTLFLDEVGEMPPSLQVKLLRAIEYGEILPVGADQPVHVDVRIISATHRDLNALQAQGDFREDLFWRICGAQVQLPALRDRPEDIPLLANFFLHGAASLCHDGLPKQLTPEAEAALTRHHWPGNMRELRHELQRASVLCPHHKLSPEDFSFSPSTQSAAAAPLSTALTLQEKVQRLERQEISAALTQAQGNRTHAAKALGLSRQGLLNKMERYNISAPASSDEQD